MDWIFNIIVTLLLVFLDRVDFKTESDIQNSVCRFMEHHLVKLHTQKINSSLAVSLVLVS